MAPSISRRSARSAATAATVAGSASMANAIATTIGPARNRIMAMASSGRLPT